MQGEGAEGQKCNIKKCPEWSDWTPWSEGSGKYLVYWRYDNDKYADDDDVVVYCLVVKGSR